VSAPIRIIDVIATTTPYSGGRVNYSVIVDRMPVRVYERSGLHLTSCDSGFYDFLVIEPGSSKAFAGSKFDLNMADGTVYNCHGQVWSCGPTMAPEPTIEVGIGTIEELTKCHVYSAASVSIARLNEWLAVNTPSRNRYKYDPHYTMAWADRVLRQFGQPVSAQRATKLRRAGKTVWRDDAGRRLWSPGYERHKATLAELAALDGAPS